MNVHEYISAVRQARAEFEEEIEQAGVKMMESLRLASSKFIGDFEPEMPIKEDRPERMR